MYWDSLEAKVHLIPQCLIFGGGAGDILRLFRNQKSIQFHNFSFSGKEVSDSTMYNFWGWGRGYSETLQKSKVHPIPQLFFFGEGGILGLFRNQQFIQFHNFSFSGGGGGGVFWDSSENKSPSNSTTFYGGGGGGGILPNSYQKSQHLQSYFSSRAWE